jgi:hypothetical protein
VYIPVEVTCPPEKVIIYRNLLSSHTQMITLQISGDHITNIVITLHMITLQILFFYLFVLYVKLLLFVLEIRKNFLTIT